MNGYNNEFNRLLDDITYWGAVAAVGMFTVVGMFGFLAFALHRWF